MPFSTKKYGPSIRDAQSVFERETRRITETFNSRPMADGILLTNVPLSGVTTRVQHRLSRPYRGFLVVNMNAGGFVWVDSTDSSSSLTTIPLKASSTMTVSLWVF